MQAQPHPLPTRRESDALGTVEVPGDALYGANTLRGVQNFALSGRTIGDEPSLVRALASIKRAAALANRDVGALSDDQARAIVAACDEILAGKHHEQFVIDLMEGSGGTSINMNANEVIANLAILRSGGTVGQDDRLTPNDHVNRGQSTNDVVPSAVKLAVHARSAPLIEALEALGQAFLRKAAEFADVLRVGRTCLQSAQPMTLGQAFGGYGAALLRQREKVAAAADDLLVLPLGATAIGTGMGATPGYREAVYRRLATQLGKPVRPAADLFDGMQNSDAFARMSSELRIAAEVIGKICGDLVFLSSDAASGIGEIRLPAVQPGSSIMPGKVNPVLPMMMQQVAFAIAGNDATVSLACLHGQLEINHFEPVVASRLFDSLDLLTRGARALADKCILGIEANAERSLQNLLNSSALATAFLPSLGYARVSRIVKAAEAEGRPFLAVAVEMGLLSDDQVIAAVRESTRLAAAPGTDLPPS